MSMTEEDILKLKAVTLYVLEKCGETDYIHLFKILYFAERQHYAHYGQHLINDKFYALPKGPVPSFLYDAVKVASGLKKHHNGDSLDVISSALAHGEGECQYYYISGKENPDMEELSRADIKSLDEAIALCKDEDSNTLSSMSHDEAWSSAYKTHANSEMDSLLMAKAGGATNGFIEYIAEQEKLNRVLVG